MKNNQNKTNKSNSNKNSKYSFEKKKENLENTSKNRGSNRKFISKMMLWLLSTLLIISVGLNIYQGVVCNQKYFLSNLGEEITFNVKSGINIASVYYPTSVVSNVAYEQPLNIVLLDDITSLKLKFEGSIIEDKENIKDILINLDENWEFDGEYYKFLGETLPNSQFSIKPKITLPKSISKDNSLNIISIILVAN